MRRVALVLLGRTGGGARRRARSTASPGALRRGGPAVLAG
jgi:hypothetical protein